MNKSYNTDFVIIGAGIAGLTLACLLEKQSSYRILIVEQTLAVRKRVSAINELSAAIWRYLDLWNELEVSPYYHMQVWDYCGGEIHFDSSPLSNQPLGYIVEDHRLHQALLQKISHSSQIRLLSNEACLEIIEDANGLCLQTQNSLIHAKYLIGCDGACSWVREHMKFSMAMRSYDHTAITAQIITEKPHGLSARQKFTKEGPLAFLPLLDKHHCSLVWSVSPQRAEEYLSLSDESFMALLAHNMESCLGAISSIGQRFSFPLMMRHVDYYFKNRVILCGDAAHTIHPLAGQGLNLGMQDILALTQAIMDIELGVNANKAFRDYERKRKTANQEMRLIMAGIKRCYEFKSPFMQMMIQKGVLHLNKMSLIKSCLLNLASGKHHYPDWLL